MQICTFYDSNFFIFSKKLEKWKSSVIIDLWHITGTEMFSFTRKAGPGVAASLTC